MAAKSSARAQSADAPSASDLTGVVREPDPIAATDQMVVAGNVRFTVLTDRLVRLEYADDGVFEDRPSLAVVNRRFPRQRFTTKRSGDSLEIDTGTLRVSCSDSSRPFSQRRLSAQAKGSTKSWRFGDPDRQNLGGTARTLDMWDGRSMARVTGFDPEVGVQYEWDEQSLEPGLLSLSGFSTFDDTATVVLDPAAGGRAARGRPWPTPRPEGERTDVYLFAYGEDHSGALAAASRLFGPQPLPPRFAFGYWYSRYYPYTHEELLDVVAELDLNGIPTDVLVIDMDWHRLGWTGYSWDRELFPDPTATLAAIHDHNLRVCLNLHPADGVASHEDAFDEFCELMGIDPDGTEHIPFDVTDPRFVEAYLKLLHHPEEDRGVDFWWMDWQQGTETTIPGLDPLGWLNHLHWEDSARRRPNRRPLSFSRWDGVGAGRHPVGFSGDTYSTWKSLAYQPEFTATAANVLYGYWSHDIGGHLGSVPDPELYSRWLQFGAFSPVLRTHGTLDPLAERKVWEFTSPYRQVMIDAIRRRYELVPYIYGECRRGLDSGLSLVRPMYHEHPSIRAAYEVPGQYMFGSDMIVAPIVSPVGEDQLATVNVWLPRGAWYDSSHGTLIEVDEPRGRIVERSYLLEEIPVFVRGGAVIPSQEGATRLSDVCYSNLVFNVYPGAVGRHLLYEDDGTTQGYLKDRSVNIAATQRSSAGRRELRIGPAEGSYRGWRRRRDVEVRFVGELPPRSVELNGESLSKADTPTPGHWSFDPEEATVSVSMLGIDLGVENSLRILRASGGAKSALLQGVPGLLRRLTLADRTTRTLLGDDNRRMVGLRRSVENAARHPSELAAAIGGVRSSLGELIDMLGRHLDLQRQMDTLKPLDEPVNTQILASMQDLLERTRNDFG